MGQESSTPVNDSTLPETLSARTLDAVASYIREGHAKKIVLMTGAGISTAAGIPDFRSPETGLYANLAKLNLPYPEAVFDISYFRSNPLPFYTLAHELYPGKYSPTISHCFIRLLSDKGLLLKLFTQNIDCLERAAGVPADRIIEAHGSFARQRCIECQSPYPDDLMKQAISRQVVPHCSQDGCKGLVKPDIVFFGEALPEDFHLNRLLPGAADLAIIMGTSLTVQPFAGLPSYCSEGIPRVLLNLDRVGGLGSRADDVLILGDIDTGVRRLASAIGWLDELEALFKSCNPSRLDDHLEVNHKSHDDVLNDEVAKITEEIDRSLQISEQYSKALQEDLSLPERRRTQPGVSKDETVLRHESTAGIPTSHQRDDQGASTLGDPREEEIVNKDNEIVIVTDEKPQSGESAEGKVSL